MAAGTGPLERDCELAAITGKVIVPLPTAPTDYQRNEAGLETARAVLQAHPVLAGVGILWDHSCAGRDGGRWLSGKMARQCSRRRGLGLLDGTPCTEALAWEFAPSPACFGDARYFAVYPVSVGVLAAVWSGEIPGLVLLALPGSHDKHGNQGET